MLGICGYNLCFDENSLDASVINMGSITRMELQDGIIDQLHIDKDTDIQYTASPYNQWDYTTIMNASYDTDLNAGNISQMISQAVKIKVKRRIQGTYDWLTIAEIPINSDEDFSFSINDFINKNGVTYEYAVVPVQSDDVEGDYIINSIYSNFNGVYICDGDYIYKFISKVDYGTYTSVQKVGNFEPIGSKYPIIVSNGDINYHTGEVNGMLLNSEYEETREIDRTKLVEIRESIDSFLKNKKAKVLKDWNGNIWLMIVTNEPTMTFTEDGMAIANISFQWTEIGDPNNQEDLYYNGVLEVI